MGHYVAITTYRKSTLKYMYLCELGDFRLLAIEMLIERHLH